MREGDGMRVWLVILPFLAILALWAANLGPMGGEFGVAAAQARSWFSNTFAWIFVGAALFGGVVLVIASLALGTVRIGGADERPRLSWFGAVAVGFAACTSMGLFFWAAAEPLFHMHDPPAAAGVIVRSKEAQILARAATFAHWAILSQIVFGVMMVGFAVSAQTIGRASSLDGLIFRSHRQTGGAGTIFDCLAIFFATLLLVGGLASAVAPILQLGTGSAVPGPIALGIGIGLCVIVILLCGGRPPQKTYLAFAKWSLALLLVMLGLVALFGPKGGIIVQGLSSLWYMFKYSGALFWGGFAEIRDGWAVTWTVTHLSGWMIFAPLIGYFLSEAARGYRVFDAVIYFILLPGLISALTIMILGGASLYTDQQTNGLLWEAVMREGAGAALFGSLGELSIGPIVRAGMVMILIASFIGFAAALLFSIMRFVAPGDGRDGKVIAQRRSAMMVWAVLFGSGAWVVAAQRLSEPVEALGRLGGLSGLLIFVLATFSLLRLCAEPIRRIEPMEDDVADLSEYVEGDDQETFQLEVRRAR